jgi:hypothetical protein
MRPNWLATVPNPFNLPTPSAGFLQDMAAFDPDLVLYPSQQEFFYRLARRATFGPGLLSALSTGTDSAVCVEHKLVPVTSIKGDAHFGPHILQWLADRDTWRHGGAKAVNRLLDERDADADKQARRERDSENTVRARSMWRTFARRTGQSVALSDVHRGRGQIRSKHRVTPRTHSGQTPPTATPAGWQPSASGLVVPPTL